VSELRLDAGGVGPSNTATQCRSLVFQATIFAINVKGTESSAPIGPSSQPQANIDKRTINGETLSDRPSAFGSMMLPITVLTTAMPAATNDARPTPCVDSAIKTGGMAETKLPIVGTKCNANVTKPHSAGFGTPHRAHHSPAHKPVAALVADFTLR
jgi:hypothetical protein